MTARIITLRYAGTCSACDAHLEPGAKASWDRDRRAATCTSCLPREQTEPVVAGASAQRIADQRRAKHQQQLDNSRFPRLARLVDKIEGESQSTQAWAKGAEGERRIGRALDALRDKDIGVLHDRRKPGGRGNIDHLAVASTGIWGIDSKHYKGLVERRDKGGWFREDMRLYVRGRDQTKLIEGVHGQVSAIRRLTDEAIPVHGALCFVESDWKPFARPFEIDGVAITWWEALAKLLEADGPLDATARQHWTAHLEQRLRGA